MQRESGRPEEEAKENGTDEVYLKLHGLRLVPHSSLTDSDNQSVSEPCPGCLGYYEGGDWDEFVPPENLAMVVKGIYRAAMPKKKSFPYLKRMGLKAVLCLFQEDYPEGNLTFMKENGIKLLQYGVPGNKEPFVDIPEDIIREALVQLLDVRNHPILIHCNKGKHRTGCLVGCLRKIQSWSHTSISDEYQRFSFPKARIMDQQFIELFDTSKVNYNKQYRPVWL